MVPANLRLVTLDFPKEMIHLDEVARILGDVVRYKQINFERASKGLVTMDKHDMIGTHHIIYDVQRIYQPKVIAAIRTTYEDRAKAVNVPLPVDTYSTALPFDAQKRLAEFRKRNGPSVDCNGLFIDAEYTESKSGLELGMILHWIVTLHLRRLGYDHWIGATNERFKASRWLSDIGTFPEGTIFNHPYFPSPHKLVTMEGFRDAWMLSIWEKYSALVKNRYELIASSIRIKSMEAVIEGLRKPRHLRVA